MVFQYHGTGIAEEWRDLRTQYYQVVKENIVERKEWVLESPHNDAGTRPYLRYCIWRWAC